MMDILIRGGTVIDGTGTPGVLCDLGIKGDKIVFIGQATDTMCTAAKRVIDATGKVVSPGFVDCHTHSDLSLFSDPSAKARLYGGVTTEIAGNCGLGVAPIAEKNREDLEKYFLSFYPVDNQLQRPLFRWNSFREYLASMERYCPAINVGSLVAQGAVRIAVKGFEKGSASPEEISKMQALVSESMAAGAFGISTGLNYLPGAFCGTQELLEVTKPLAPYGGMYVSHIRDQTEGLLTSLEEAFTIASQAGVGAHISHLKLMGPGMWGKTDALFDKIEEARSAGLPVSFDAYPYEAGATGITALLPHWAMEGGIPALMDRLTDPGQRERIQQDCIHGLPGWQAMIKSVGFEKIALSDVAGNGNKAYIGKTLCEIAHLRGQPAFDALFDLLLEEQGKASIVISHMEPRDVDTIISHPDCMIASDSVSFAFGKPHPRFYGTNGRVFRYYVREKKLLRIEDAIRKMTSLPARQFRIAKRGELREGFYADVLVFDPDVIGDLATYDAPTQYSIGMQAVIVNGRIALDDGMITGQYAGRVIRRNEG